MLLWLPEWSWVRHLCYFRLGSLKLLLLLFLKSLSVCSCLLFSLCLRKLTVRLLFLLKFPQFFHHFIFLKLFTSLVFSLEPNALSIGSLMFFHILKLNEALAVRTLFSASSADFNVIKQLFNRKQFVTVFANLRPQLAVVFMVPELRCQLTELAVLARNHFMRSRFMLVFISLRNDFSTNLAFVVAARTPDVVHPEFRGIDHSFTCGTFLLLFCLLNHF